MDRIQIRLARYLVFSVLLSASFHLGSALAQSPGTADGWRSTRLSDASSGDALLPPPPAINSHVTLASGGAASPTGMPGEHGQVWKEYDISRYTSRHAPEMKPEQTIVDWVLRETGTEMWFSSPVGVLSADRDVLRVYHRPEIQELVAEVVDRFLRPETESHLFGLRLVTVSNPNWRTKELPRLRSVMVQTAGVEAWLLSHEDAAIVLADLRRRNDFREHNSANSLIRNGDTHTLRRMRPVSYVKSVASAPGGWGGQQMAMGQIEEGFSLRLSPLMALDGRHLDAVIKIDSTQVERMNTVAVSTPTPQNPRLMSSIKVPQTSSWGLHERFHWPADEVLLISCGVVAALGPESTSSLGLPVVNLPGRPPRCDALLFIESKGRAGGLSSSDAQQAQTPDLNYRGRY